MTEFIRDRLEATFLGLFGADAATANSMTRGVEPWDSLRHLELVFAVEDEFGVALSAEVIADVMTLADLARVVEAAGAT